MQLFHCLGLIVKGVKITNHFNSTIAKIQNDGIDLLSDSNSHVSRCFVLTQDDAMCLKGSYASLAEEGDGPDMTNLSVTEEAYPTDMSNVTFSNNIVYTSCAGAKFGMQAKAAMSDSLFQDIYVVHARRAVVVEATEGSQPMRNLRFERVYVDVIEPTLTRTPAPIQIDTKCNIVRNITVKQLFFAQPLGAIGGSSSIKGKSTKYNIEGVHFVDVRFGQRPPIKSAAEGRINIEEYATDITFSP